MCTVQIKLEAMFNAKAVAADDEVPRARLKHSTIARLHPRKARIVPILSAVKLSRVYSCE